MSFRAAVIGCGRIGSGFADDPLLAGDVYTHCEAYVRSAGTELVAICDRDPDVATRCGKRWSVPSSTTVEELLGAEPEIVSVCTPDETHYGLARQVLGAPSVRAILCEKPLSTTVEQGRELIQLARERGKLIAVAYVRRYADNLRALRRLLAEGEAGAVCAVSGWYGKGVLHNGSPWFDLLRMLAGEVAWVEATDGLGEGGDDPSLDVTLGLASGAVATLRAIDSRAYTIFEMDLLAERGRVAIGEGGHRIELYRAQPSARYSGYAELSRQPRDFGDMRNLMLHAVDDLADALASGRAPLCTGEDGLAALRIADAARRSAAEGGKRIEVLA
jgi:predicted dehydrogenase